MVEKNEQFVEKLCDERHENLNKQIDTVNKRLDTHNGKIDTIEKAVIELTLISKNLVEKVAEKKKNWFLFIGQFVYPLLVLILGVYIFVKK